MKSAGVIAFGLAIGLTSVASNGTAQIFTAPDMSAKCASEPQLPTCQMLKKIYIPPTGVLPQLLGVWSNGRFVWVVEKVDHQSTRINVYESNGKNTTSYLIKPQRGGGFTSAAPMSNFGMYLYTSNDYLIFRTPNHFQLTNATLIDGQARPQPDDPAWNGVYRRLPPPELAEWQRTLAALARRKAEGQAALGQMLATGVAVAGVAAAGGDLSAVPLSGNAYEILQGANAELARRRSEVNSASSTAQSAQLQRQAEGQLTAKNGERMVSRPSGPMVSKTSSPRTIRIWFSVGMAPKADEMRNPNCVSNVFNLPQALDPKDPNFGEKALAAAAAYEAVFLRKCERLGRLTENRGTPMLEYFIHDWSPPRLGSNDRYVVMP